MSLAHSFMRDANSLRKFRKQVRFPGFSVQWDL